MNLMKTGFAFLAAAAFIVCSAYAGTTSTTTSNSKKTTTPAKTNTPKKSIFDEKSETKKEKSVMIPPSGWTGTLEITTDPSGKQTATFTNAIDKKKYTVAVDDASKGMIAGIKTGSNVLIKGSYVAKTDGTGSIRLSSCNESPVGQ